MTAAKALWDANWSRAMGEVYWPKRAKVVLPKDLAAFYAHVADHIGRDAAIDYFEFGVAQGRSLRLISEVFTNQDSRFFGFDSFIGLPEKWQMHSVGSFTNKGRYPNIVDSRVKFVPGWFQNSVPPFFADLSTAGPRQTLVHIDSDLYSAALFLLATLWSRFDGYFFIFDNFIYDEVIALRDFCTAFPVELVFYAQTRGGGDPPNPDQVFGRMTKIPFVLPDGTSDGTSLPAR
jgi:Macrocin-O-methyltransferase (TylF)